jgi:hypothetical protein
MKHITNRKDILQYLKNNPGWISAFACGEGCFSATINKETRLNKTTWGFYLGFDFNITQSWFDFELLHAINEFFNEAGVFIINILVLVKLYLYIKLPLKILLFHILLNILF